MSGSDPFTPTPPSPFAHGPYTDDTDAFTAPAPLPRREVNRNIRTAAYIALFLIFVGCVIGAVGANSAHKEEQPRESLPVCEHEDGSTQKACIFPSDRGAIVNLDYGRYSYDTTNNRVHDYGEGYGK